MKLKVSIATCMLGALFLVGCGSSGSSNNSNNTSTNTNKVNGQVIDGPVKGATVFIDSNRNGKLDNGELSTTTDENGTFSFNTDDINAPIVSVGGIDTTTDEEVNDTLTIPANVKSHTITPVTTMVAHLVKDGLSLEEAQQKVAKILGVSEKDLFANPLTDSNATKATLQVIALQQNSKKNIKEIAKVVKECNDSEQLVKKLDVNPELIQKIHNDHNKELHKDLKAYQIALTIAADDNKSIDIDTLADKLKTIDHERINKKELIKDLKEELEHTNVNSIDIQAMIESNPNLIKKDDEEHFKGKFKDENENHKNNEDLNEEKYHNKYKYNDSNMSMNNKKDFDENENYSNMSMNDKNKFDNDKNENKQNMSMNNKNKSDNDENENKQNMSKQSSNLSTPPAIPSTQSQNKNENKQNVSKQQNKNKFDNDKNTKSDKK